MLTFVFRGSIADVDETVPGEPLHPLIVLLIDADDTISGVVVPAEMIHATELSCYGSGKRLR